MIRREESNAQAIFEEGVFAVQRASQPSPGDGNRRLSHDEARIVRPESVDCETDLRGLHTLAGADEDPAAVGLLRIDGDVSATATEARINSRVIARVIFRRLINEVMRLVLAEELFVFVTTEGVASRIKRKPPA